jgi:hypothetical protein
LAKPCHPTHTFYGTLDHKLAKTRKQSNEKQNKNITHKESVCFFPFFFFFFPTGASLVFAAKAPDAFIALHARLGRFERLVLQCVAVLC